MTCALFCELFIALIAKERYSTLCFLVLLKKDIMFFQFSFSISSKFLNAISILPQIFYGICGGSRFTIVVVVV